jgi:hypothetical protein
VVITRTLALVALAFILLTGVVVLVLSYTSSRAVLDLTEHRTICVAPEPPPTHAAG